MARHSVDYTHEVSTYLNTKWEEVKPQTILKTKNYTDVLVKILIQNLESVFVFRLSRMNNGEFLGISYDQACLFSSVYDSRYDKCYVHEESIKLDYKTIQNYYGDTI